VITALALTPADARRARAAALARLGQALALGRRDAHGARPEAALALHVDGARAELAFARMIGADLAEWSAYSPGDLGAIGSDVAGWQVRSTRYREGHLVIYPRDDPDARFALVVTNGFTYRAAGWIGGRDARRPQWWRQLRDDRYPAWCVPQNALLPF
jgi:hypothetical protein